MPQLQPHMRHQLKNAQHKRMHDGSMNASTLGVWRAHLRPGVGVWHTHSHSHGRTQTDRDAGKEARGERREARGESPQKKRQAEARERDRHASMPQATQTHACHPVSETETGGQGEAELLKS
jgi:hypothetical protein